MIPKIIHYCWFGGKEIPEDQKEYMASWKKYCPDYEIVRWDETTFDIESNMYVAEAYRNKKYAFVTDYVRLYAMTKFGGIYMDTDVEVTKSLDCFLQERAFSGFEDEKSVPTGIMASEKDFSFFKLLLSDYDNKHFVRKDGSFDTTTNCDLITKHCVEKGLVLNNKLQRIEGFALYPNDYFCPKDHHTGKINMTENTHTIHHFNGSWVDERTQRWRESTKWLYTFKLGKIVTRTVIFRSIRKIHNEGMAGFKRKIKEKVLNCKNED